MNATGLPLGWGDAQLAYFRDDNADGSLPNFVGLLRMLLTALAGSLGAPFGLILSIVHKYQRQWSGPEEGDPTNPKARNHSTTRLEDLKFR